MKRQGRNQALVILDQKKEHYHEFSIDDSQPSLWPYGHGASGGGSEREAIGVTRCVVEVHAARVGATQESSGWKWWMTCEYKRVRINTRTEL